MLRRNELVSAVVRVLQQADEIYIDEKESYHDTATRVVHTILKLQQGTNETEKR